MNLLTILKSSVLPSIVKQSNENARRVSKLLNEVESQGISTLHIDDKIYHFSEKEVSSAIIRVANKLSKSNKTIDYNSFRKLMEMSDVVNKLRPDSDSFTKEQVGIGLFSRDFLVESKVEEILDKIGYVCDTYEGQADQFTITNLIQVLESELKTDLIERRKSRLLINILTGLINLINLTVVQIPLIIIRYKYHNLVFSFKEEIALTTSITSDFIATTFNLNNNEKKYFRDIRTAC